MLRPLRLAVIILLPLGLLRSPLEATDHRLAAQASSQSNPTKPVAQDLGSQPAKSSSQGDPRASSQSQVRAQAVANNSPEPIVTGPESVQENNPEPPQVPTDITPNILVAQIKSLPNPRIEELVSNDSSPEDHFGNSVAISGKYALVGAAMKDSGDARAVGAAYIFKQEGEGWIQQAKLLAPDGAEGDNFATSVALSGDYALIGAEAYYLGGQTAGAAYVFKRQGEQWILQTKLLPSDGVAKMSFGAAVALNDRFAFVGIHNLSMPGAVYVYERLGDQWIQQTKLTAGGNNVGDGFGLSLALSGKHALIGAPALSSPGVAYIFELQDNQWVQRQKLDYIDPAPHSTDYFGASVALSGDYALVGAYNKKEGDNHLGAAYFYQRRGNRWVQQQKISPDRSSKNFGRTVALRGDCALIGTPRLSNTGVPGAAFVYLRQGEQWVQQRKLMAPRAREKTYFGWALAFDGKNALVGELKTNASVDLAQAYLFESVVFRQVSIGQVQGLPGTRTLVPIYLDRMADLTGVQLKIAYDPSKLAVDGEGVQTGDFTNGFLVEVDVRPEDGLVALALVSPTRVGAAVPGLLLEVPFLVKEGAAPGEVIQVEIEEAKLIYQTEGQTTVEPQKRHGGVEVTDLSPGDVDGDGVRALEDVALILYQVAGLAQDLSAFQAQILADANQDGSVGVDDALLVLDEVVQAKLVAPQQPASQRVVFELPALQGQIGHSLRVPIHLDTEQAVRGIDLDLRYDPTQVSLEDIDLGPANALVVHNEQIPGQIRLVGLRAAGFALEEGILGHLHFRVQEAGPVQVEVEQVQLFGADNQPLKVGQAGEIAAGLPQAFELLPNFPNPFNPETTIRYQLAQAGPVQIAIYNALGQQVESRFFANQAAGLHQMHWQASDQAAGLYLLLVEAQGHRQSAKMLLLK